VTELFDKPMPDPWWKDAVESYRRPPPDELPEGYVDAYQTRSVLMDTTKYMPYIMKQFVDLGGTYDIKEVKDIAVAFGKYDSIVNCTGLGSRCLFDDKEVYPVRGQVVF
jgi:hypothetical protein